MATLKNVSGTGYGSAYLDALINGGPIWDMSTGPIHFLWGNPEDRVASYAVHGDSPYLVDSGLAGRWGNCYTWWGETTYYPDERSPIAAAIEQFESVCGIRFDLAQSWAEADMVAWKTGLPVNVYSEAEKPQYKDTTGSDNKQSWLYLDAIKGIGEEDVGSWNNVHPGGFGFDNILHMFGLAVGLANTHDGGDYTDRTTFPGVTGPYDIGPQGLNQAPFTVMSSNYNLRGYEQVQGKWGSMKTLGAFDIAALQKLYGVNNETATGNDVYELPTKNERFGGWWDVVAPGWSCIWDAGGIDTISGQNSQDSVTIDLRAATLIDNDPNAGGFISQQRGIAGGFTIANGAVIENATGGFGNDTLIGNSANNVLNGGGGADRMVGGAGNDTYYVDNAGDVIEDTSGVNTIIATTSYILNGVRVNGSGVVDSDAIIIKGDAGSQSVIGNAKDNTLYGKAGNDMLTGGAGRDIFVFDTKPSKKTNFDTITDFNVKDDTIWLDNKYFKKLGKGSESKPGKLNKAFFKIDTKAKDKNDYLVYNKKTGILYYDADGSGSNKAIEIARLDKGLKLSNNDFSII